MSKNVVAFQNNMVVEHQVVSDVKRSNEVLAYTVTAELLKFGYILSNETISELRTWSAEELTKFHNEVISYLKIATGSTRNYTPFWKGFPQEVMEKSEVELWMYQIVHYLSGGTFEPNEWTKTRATAFEQPSYTVVNLATKTEFSAIFTRLVGGNQSLTPNDLEVVKWFHTSGQELVMPDRIPFKETMCTLASLGVYMPVSTPTDVLRIAVGLSGGDISLPALPPKKIATNRWSRVKSINPARDGFKFRKFKRSERKYLLTLLERTSCNPAEAVLKEGRWTRLAEVLHPGEFSHKFPKAFKMFDAIRNQQSSKTKKGIKVQSWYGLVDEAFKTASFETALDLLSTRPGELFRKLDWLIRKNYTNKARLDLILSTIELVGVRVSNKVIFEVYTHFQKRIEFNEVRRIMVKGARKSTTLPTLDPIPSHIVDKVSNSLMNTLATKFKSLPNLGKVYLDEELQKIPMPTNMRSMNGALKPTIRGQRVPMGNQNAKVIRAYVHWFDQHGREDLDLTGTFVGLGKLAHIGWNGRHNSSELGCYSGDIRHKVGACAEYIDINLVSALRDGYEYVVIDVRNYQGRGLDTVKECVFGYMEREFPKANEVFVPATIANAVQLKSKSATTVVCIIDLKTQEYIFLDVDQDGIPVASANVGELLNVVKQYSELPKFSVYDLLLLHVTNRGELVDQVDKAETVFSYSDFDNYAKIFEYMGV